MAQSRGPHSSHREASPHSPRTHGDKKHHSRRKSGRTEHLVAEKKSSRPPTVNRKITPQIVTKVGSSTSRGHGQGHGHGHKHRDDDERGRDSGESFPQFCMSCEKQFLPANDTFLYCSEACRIHDLNPRSARADSYTSIYASTSSHSPPLTPYTRTFPTHEDGPDIIPRFSPTQPRPRSYFASEPYPSSYHHVDTQLSQSTPYHTSTEYPSTTRTNSSALESLRELATALPPSKPSRKSSHHQEDSHSPPKSSASSINRTSSGVWNYMPFTKTSTPAATPGNSYTSQSASYSMQNGYGNASREDLYTYGASASHGYNYSTTGSGVGVTTAAYTHTGGMGMDRPLPPRSGPGGYGHRPKSIDLVTPFSGH